MEITFKKIHELNGNRYEEGASFDSDDFAILRHLYRHDIIDVKGSSSTKVSSAGRRIKAWGAPEEQEVEAHEETRKDTRKGE